MKKPLTIAALSIGVVVVIALLWNTYWQVAGPTRSLERELQESEQRTNELRERLEQQP